MGSERQSPADAIGFPFRCADAYEIKRCRMKKLTSKAVVTRGVDIKCGLNPQSSIAGYRTPCIRTPMTASKAHLTSGCSRLLLAEGGGTVTGARCTLSRSRGEILRLDEGSLDRALDRRTQSVWQGSGCLGGQRIIAAPVIPPSRLGAASSWQMNSKPGPRCRTHWLLFCSFP